MSRKAELGSDENYLANPHTRPLIGKLVDKKEQAGKQERHASDRVLENLNEVTGDPETPESETL